MILIFNYLKKVKEIEFNSWRISRDFPKFAKPLSVKFWFLYKYKILASNDFNYFENNYAKICIYL